MLDNSIGISQRTLWNSQAMPYVRETLIPYFWVCRYNKLNKFNEGNLVFADAASIKRKVFRYVQSSIGHVAYSNLP